MPVKRTSSSKGSNSQQRLSFNVRKKDNRPIDRKEQDLKSNVKAEPIEIIETNDSKEILPHLNPDDVKYQEYYQWLVKNEWSDPVHYEDYNTVDKILRQFDFVSEYGPAAGLSRLERWERAQRLGKEPPQIVKDILSTHEALLDFAWTKPRIAVGKSCSITNGKTSSFFRRGSIKHGPPLHKKSLLNSGATGVFPRKG